MAKKTKEPYPAADQHHDFPIDPRRGHLAKALKGFKVSEAACDSLHSWISSAADDRRMRRLIDTAIPKEAIAVQVDECKKLMRAAQKVADRMGLLARLAPTGQALEASYGLVASRGSEGPLDPWDTFAARVARDAALLAITANTTAENLASKKRRLGAPRKIERDSLFAEWFEKVKAASKASADEVYEIAVVSWNQYFELDKLMDVESAKKARFKGKSTSK